VTPEAITTRNRANAAKSTGPRSVAGKAAVVQNARRHGATARPDPERVATWARIILDTPDLAANHLFAGTTRMRNAMALAGAEVRLAEATRALQDFEADTTLPRDGNEALDAQIMEIDAMLTELPALGYDAHSSVSLMLRLHKGLLSRIRLDDRRHRLLKRYWREARAQRKRAFRDWLACLRAPAPAPPSADKTHKIPKQSQISA